MGDTKISWTNKSWNPIRGCSRISAGCTRCYAERVAARFSGPGQPYEGLVRLRAEGKHGRQQWNGTVRIVAEHLADPLRWRKPRRVFVNSMSDLFHESLTNEQIAAVFGVMAAAPQHTFQVLTKRARRMREWFAWVRGEGGQEVYAREALCWLPDFEPKILATEFRPWPLPNVWLGVSVENQAAADERIPELLATPAAVRFLSCEPLIGEVDLDIPRCGNDTHADDWGFADDEAMPWCMQCDSERSYGHWLHLDGGIDWVIAGCESGPGARPCSVEWLRSLRDQCAAAEVPFFLKQAVELGDDEDREDPREVGYGAGYVRPPTVLAGTGSKRKAGGVIELPYLDGVQHAAFPKETDRG